MARLFWHGWTIAGTLPVMVAACVPLGLLWSWPVSAWVFAQLGAVSIVGYLIKIFYFKPRPDNPEGERPAPPQRPLHLGSYLSKDGWRNFKAAFRYVDSSSFPSMHSARAFGIAVYLSLVSGVQWVWPLSLSVAALVGVSRIVKKRHYPFDVAIGGTLGGLLGVVFWRIPHLLG